MTPDLPPPSPPICSVQTMPGDACTWPTPVAAGFVYGPGYRRIAIMLLSDPFTDGEPEPPPIDPGVWLPNGWTWSYTRFLTAPDGSIGVETANLNTPPESRP
jgi:hypothetical protein